MFVKRSTYEELKLKYARLLTIHAASVFEHKVEELRRKEAPPQFTKEELQTIIRLCHPDKHNNSPAATRITQKLLELRQ